jgi:hypothetical protein
VASKVYNEGNNAVVVLLESDDQRCKEFFKSATLERPSLAFVDDVKSEEYTGEVMPLWQFASINTATQINKAIPILLAVEKNTDAILKETNAVHKDTSPILEEVKCIQPGFTVQFNQMQADIKAIKDRLGMP